jgi:hypothetical protein
MGAFHTLSHKWLMQFIEQDIVNKNFMELIRKMLKAGIMEVKYPILAADC